MGDSNNDAAGLEVYLDLGSQPCRAVLAFLQLAHIPHRLRLVSIRALNHSRLPGNFSGRLPFISDRGFPLCESHAIFSYLCATRQVANHWYPSEQPQRAYCDQYLHWHHTGTRYLGRYLFASYSGAKLGFTVGKGVAEEYWKYAESALAVLNDCLQGKDYILGSEVSVADLAAVSELAQMKLVPGLLESTLLRFPHIKAWFQRVYSLPEVLSAHSVIEKVAAKNQTQAVDRGQTSWVGVDWDMEEIRQRHMELSVAPMIDITNRFYRFFMRQLTTHTTLYTEMIHANAVLANPSAVLKYSPCEHPVVFQLGGCDAESLAAAAESVQRSGFDEVNLNCGCPSGRVSCGKFGACLMLEPETVRTLCASILRRVSIPLTVKCRLGVDDHECYESLHNFVSTVSQSGVTHFIVHARKALLAGLTPEQNRKIPPLQYEKVYRLVGDFPELQFTINGGFKSHEMVADAALHGVRGVMMGRWAYENPVFFRDVDTMYYGASGPSLTRREIMLRYADYCQDEVDQGEKVSNSVLAKPLTNFFKGQPGNSYYRVTLNSMMLGDQYTGDFRGMIHAFIGKLEDNGVHGLDAEEHESVETPLDKET